MRDTGLEQSRKIAKVSGQNWIADRQAELRLAREQREAEGWRYVDREITPEQLAEIRALNPEDEEQSRIVWVEYCHRALGWVVARGNYSYDEQQWIARYEPIGAGDHVRPVDVVAWCSIRPGVQLRHDRVVPDRLDKLCRAAERS